MRCDESGCDWQREGDGRTAAVLHEVFGWLSGAELSRAGAVCRAWRCVAAAPVLWRRLLARSLATAPQDQPGSLYATPSGSWRQEFVSTQAGWAIEAREQLGGAALHAALAPVTPARLALAADDGTLRVLEQRAPASDGTQRWEAVWSVGLAERGWRGVVRVQWPPRGDRLLAVGELALVDSWEVLVFHPNESGGWSVSARARCSAGAAGCWADAAGDAFLSFELSALAPRLAFSTVWLNCSSQETASEYVGVRAPLLRIFNEEGAHVTCAAVAQVPLGAGAGEELGFLVAASGCRAEGGGALAAWPLGAATPPPLLAAALGDLRERRARRAARAPAPPADAAPAPPDEAVVRALCDSPDAACALPAPPMALVFHASGRSGGGGGGGSGGSGGSGGGARVWVALLGGGAWCATLPALQPLRHLPPPPPPAGPALDNTLLHYVQPAVTDSYFVSPAGGRSGAVHVWRTRSGAESRAPPPHPAPALAALLLPAPSSRLLVLAGDELSVWRNRATQQPVEGESCPDLLL